MKQHKEKLSSKTGVFDIETNGLLLDVTTFWVGVVYIIEEDKYYTYTDLEELIEMLYSCTRIVGHNIIGYDIPAMEIVASRPLNELYMKAMDTLILSKLIMYDKDTGFSHSLKSWGQRLGEYKDHHEDWSKYSKEMEEYCKQDVTVTVRLYKHLQQVGAWLPRKAIEIEQQVQKILAKQHITGWKFDEKEATKLHIYLTGEVEESLTKLQEVFKPLFLPQGKVKEPKKPFTRLKVHTLGPHQPIVLTEFNPGSGTHIVWWVELLYGKQKWELTAKDNPKTDSDTLEKMFKDKDWAAPLLHYLEVNKLLGQLAEGPKAWLKVIRNGRIHHSVDLLGTNTGRATHNSPNLAQVPSPKAYRGKESRQLFVPTEGYVAVGCDLSGVELRCLAHYMGDAEYTRNLLEGDIHTVNQHAAGLPTRDNAKTFIYGFLYGAGDGKIGQIVNGTSKQGKALKAKFLEGLPALGTLITKVKKAAKRGYLVGVSGRRLHVRSPHSALNVLLQSLGSYISKYWMVEAHKRIEEEGIRCNQIGWIHDELQFECHQDDSKKLQKILEESATKAGEILELKCRIDAEAQEGENWYEVH